MIQQLRAVSKPLFSQVGLLETKKLFKPLMNMACPWFSPPFVTLNIEFVSSNFKGDIDHTYKLANKLLPEKADKLWRVDRINS